MARMVARLKYLGLDVRRIHSDAAQEMFSAHGCRDRSIYRTFTCGSDWKSNGWAEAEIGMIKRGVNMLLKASGDEERYWPQMARRIGERRGRLQLQALAATRPEAPMTSQGGALGVISQPIQSVLPGCPLSPPVECRVEAGFQLVFLS